MKDIFKTTCRVVRSVHDIVLKLGVILTKLHELHIIALSGNGGIHYNYKMIPLREKSFHKGIVSLKIRTLGDSGGILHCSGCDSLGFVVDSHEYDRKIREHDVSVIDGISESKIICHNHKVEITCRKDLVLKVFVEVHNIYGSVIHIGVHEFVGDLCIDAFKSLLESIELVGNCGIRIAVRGNKENSKLTL